MSKNIAIIPVRTGSKRLPQKNILEFFGHPIFMYTVQYALNCGLFDDVYVSTESEEVIKICNKYNVEVPFLRPSSLAGDSSSLEDVIFNALEQYEKQGKNFENFCLLWATSAMRTDKDIISAYGLLGDSVDGVIGVTNYDLPVFCAQYIGKDQSLEQVSPDKMWLSSQDMPEVVCDCGSMVWCKVEAFKKYNSWMPPKIKGYNINKKFAQDIDTKDDWEIAQYYYEKYFGLENSPF
ncbi:MAG: acylneuraminate cytidylyltransferase family protein [Lentisphaeraceae bacterium]|nr:acylneuraminate cytidylyltransferase family protein [Lentisphaeraceae bacterium]